MGGIGKAVKTLINGPDKIRPEIANQGYFDIGKEATAAQTQFNPALQSAQANQAAVSPYQQQALTQMGLAATGQGPSLAEMQLRSAQDRGFAQQLAAAQSQRASSPALAQRQLLLNQGNANRDLAQQSAMARLQERDAFLNQANQQQANLGSAVNQNFQLATAPKQSLQQWEMARTGAVNTANQQNAANSNALTGALLGGAGSALGGYLGKKAEGGLVTAPGYKNGGEVDAPQETVVVPDRGFGKIIMVRAAGGPVCAPTSEYKSGGPVAGPGGPKTDSIPTMLSNGEYVVKAAIVAKPGMSELLKHINAGRVEPKDIMKNLEGNSSFGKIVASRSKDKSKRDK